MTVAGRITLWGVEVFVATAEEASITAAARRLGASPATVSQQLTNLEGAIGTRLLNRAERPVTLTPAGELFLRRANAILNEAEAARAELALRGHARLTRLRIGMIEDFEADVTPRLFAALAEAMPDTQFLLETGASHRLSDALEARALDLIVAADIGQAGEGMEVHPLLEEPFVAAVPKGAVAPDEDPARRLRRMPVIRYTTRHYMGQAIAAHLARENIRLAHRFELDSYHAILAMVAAGAGWTILTPLALLRAQRFADRIETLPLPFAPAGRTIALTAREGTLGPLPRDVADRLRGLLQSQIVAPARAALPWLGDGLRLR